jgi:hypothetical protein
MKDSKLFPRKVYNLEDNTKFQDLRNHMYDSVYLSNIYKTSKPVKVLKDFRLDLAVKSITKEQMYSKVCWLLNGKVKGLWDCKADDEIMTPSAQTITSKNSIFGNTYIKYKGVENISTDREILTSNAESFKNDISGGKSNIINSALNNEISPELTLSDLISRMNSFYQKQLMI